MSTQARAGAIVLYCNSLEGGAVAQLTQLTPAGWACRGGQGVSELVEGGRGSQRGPCCYSAPHRVVLVAHDEQNTSMTFVLINHICSCCSFSVNLQPNFRWEKHQHIKFSHQYTIWCFKIIKLIWIRLAQTTSTCTK